MVDLDKKEITRLYAHDVIGIHTHTKVFTECTPEIHRVRLTIETARGNFIVELFSDKEIPHITAEE